MAITISKIMRNKLPDGERDGIDDLLWAKSGSYCFLCEAKMNRAADAIHADHALTERQKQVLLEIHDSFRKENAAAAAAAAAAVEPEPVPLPRKRAPKAAKADTASATS